MTDEDVTEDDVLDLDDKSEEPERPPFKFKFGGELYTCQAPEDLDVRDIAGIVKAADQDPSMMLPVMLAPGELERLEASPEVFDLGMLRKLSDAWQKHYELQAPKSSGSRKSSSKKIR